MSHFEFVQVQVKSMDDIQKLPDLIIETGPGQLQFQLQRYLECCQQHFYT